MRDYPQLAAMDDFWWGRLSRQIKTWACYIRQLVLMLGVEFGKPLLCDRVCGQIKGAAAVS